MANTFDRPRPIGTVDVKLDSTAKVKVFNDITHKDVYASLLTNDTLATSDIIVYNVSLNSNAADKELKNLVNSPDVPRFFLENITLIGNAAICTPGTPNFDLFPAKLKTYGSGNGEKIVDGPSDVGWVDGITPWGEFYARKRVGNQLTNNTNSDNPAGNPSTANNNVWVPSQDGEDNPCGFSESYSNDGVVKYHGLRVEDIITSEFSLKKNQPFSFKFTLFDYTAEQKAGLIAKELKQVFDPNSNTVGASQYNSEAYTPHVVITWGGGNYQLTFFNNGIVRLMYQGNQVGKDWVIPGKKEDIKQQVQLTVYPLGNAIYVYSGGVSTEATVKRLFRAFSFDKAVEISAGKISLAFRCGKGKFNFSPVVHHNNGRITSPLIGTGFVPDSKLFNVAYVGKFGVGVRESPISFPDVNDKKEVFGYLKNNVSIEYAFNDVKDDIFTYSLNLNVKSDVDNEFYDLDKFYQAAVKDIDTAVGVAQNSVNDGSATTAQATSTLQSSITSTFNTLVTNTESNLGKIFKNLEMPANSTTLINGKKVDLLGYLGGLSDQLGSNLWGYGSNATSQTRKIKNNFKKNVNRMKIMKAGDNIYSPAVFFSQITFKKDLADVNLNPNPQIENSDVMQISVEQKVEGASASFVLNNRQPCGGNSNEAIGKYTYIPGETNFCGIKPITIKAGYSGEQSDSDLPVLFTGYLTKRNYSRPAANQSIVSCQCEDVSKKLKEQFAVNLPFFDGWCVQAVVYYLCKQAGFQDDEILLYQNPQTGQKVRIRDILVGDPDTFTGGCFDGHINEDPPGVGSFPGSYLHMTLPLAALGVEEPNYNFSFGTSLWACLQRIREFSSFYLYANNYGNIVCGPPKAIIRDTGLQFKEVDTAQEYNEFTKRLDIDFDTSDTRNMVYVQGLTFLGNANAGGKDALGQWVPHIHIKRKSNFPNDIGDHSYAPWIRYAFMRNPKWEFPSLTALAAEEMFRRLVKLKANSSFSAWGQPNLFPYDVITINEELNNETGANGLKFIIGAHTFTISTDNYQPQSSFNCEIVDETLINYDPNLPPNIRD